MYNKYKENLTFSVVNKDCMEYMSTVQDNYFDLSVTSPPYNIGGKYRDYKDNLSKLEYESWLCKVIHELIRTSRLTAFNIQYNTANMKTVWNLFGNFDNHIKDVMIWKKQGFTSTIFSSDSLTANYEFIFIFEKNTASRRYSGNFINFKEKELCFDSPNNSSLDIESFHTDEHTAIMPIRIARRMIELFSAEKELVFDPFNGTGTTGVAAIQLKRKFIGTDISQRYCEIAENRIVMELNQKRF